MLLGGPGDDVQIQTLTAMASSLLQRSMPWDDTGSLCFFGGSCGELTGESDAYEGSCDRYPCRPSS